MRDYEYVFVIHPDLDEAALKELLEKIQGLVNAAGGQVQKLDLWGRRRLAFPLRKHKEGQYVIMQASLAPKASAELERSVRFLEPVLRYLITVK
ncbi:MAG: 30S ribosomal protein S6 [Chloroflexi bacterium]|nr:30S ribosomal protein S6 [Chloroflexota bacterium]